MAETGIRLVTNSECKMKGDGYCPRPLEKTAFLSKKWALSIIVTIGNFGTLRFNSLLNRISGITQKTLAERLQELEGHNLISRTAFSEKPPRVEYSLTRNGEKVRKAILPLIKLAESNAFSKNAYSPRPKSTRQESSSRIWARKAKHTKTLLCAC